MILHGICQNENKVLIEGSLGILCCNYAEPLLMA